MKLPKSFVPKKNLDSLTMDFLMREDNNLSLGFKRNLKGFIDFCKYLHKNQPGSDVGAVALDFLNNSHKIHESYLVFHPLLSSSFKHFAPYTLECVLFYDGLLKKLTEQGLHEADEDEVKDAIIKISERDNSCVNFLDVLNGVIDFSKDVRSFAIPLEIFMVEAYNKFIEEDLKEPAEFAVRAILFPYVYSGSKDSPKRQESVDTRLRPFISKLGYCEKCIEKSKDILYKTNRDVHFCVEMIDEVLKGVYRY